MEFLTNKYKLKEGGKPVHLRMGEYSFNILHPILINNN